MPEHDRPRIPLVALFPDGKHALSAIAALRPRQLSSPAPGILLMAPEPGLAARLYAAGAALVTG